MKLLTRWSNSIMIPYEISKHWTEWLGRLVTVCWIIQVSHKWRQKIRSNKRWKFKNLGILPRKMEAMHFRFSLLEASVNRICKINQRLVDCNLVTKEWYDVIISHDVIRWKYVCDGIRLWNSIEAAIEVFPGSMKFKYGVRTWKWYWNEYEITMKTTLSCMNCWINWFVT